jgi:hypothetical protein
MKKKTQRRVARNFENDPHSCQNALDLRYAQICTTCFMMFVTFCALLISYKLILSLKNRFCKDYIEGNMKGILSSSRHEEVNVL